MGKDIHFAFQEKKDNGDYRNIELTELEIEKFLDRPIIYGRMYSFWDFLNDNGNPNCPEELENISLYKAPDSDYYYWDTTDKFGLFDFHHIDLINLEKAFRAFVRKFEVGTWVSYDFFSKFKACGGVFPEEMVNKYGEIEVIEEEDLFLVEQIEEFIQLCKDICHCKKIPKENFRIAWHYDW